MKKNQNSNNVGKIARGSWQKSILQELEVYGEISSPLGAIAGKARQYGDLYQKSFWNLLSRMEKAGYIVSRIPGVRGGEYTARYVLVRSPFQQAN